MAFGYLELMANLIYFAQFGNTTLSEKDDYAMARISMIGAGLSSVGCCLNIFLILTIRHPLQTNGSFIAGNHCLALLLSQMSLMGVENAYPSSSKIYCKIVTGFVHFIYLSIQFWGLCLGISFLTQTHPSKKLSKHMGRSQYAFIGWFVPLVMAVTTALIRWDEFGHDKWCWLPQSHSTNLAFLLPLIVTILINTVALMSLISYVNRSKVHAAKRGKWKTILAAIPIMGFPWLLGFVPANGDDITLVFNYLFLVFTSPQGLFLLISQLRGSIAMWNAQSNSAVGTNVISGTRDEPSDSKSCATTVECA